MSDKEIIQKLIDHDNLVTHKFFYEYCKPMFRSIIHWMFDYSVDYDEFVNEIYVYLMEDEARRLKTFKGDCSLYGWLRMVTIHYFTNKKNHSKVIENVHQEPLFDMNDEMQQVNETNIKFDVEKILKAMPNQRYAYVIRKLYLEEMEPVELAKEMGVTVDNLYNIKRRAIAQFTQVALDYFK